MQPDPTTEPSTPACRAARSVAERYCSPSLFNHSVRSYVWGAEAGRRLGIAFDAELLYVAACLHDLGLTPRFDNNVDAFEVAGGNVAWVFAVGAGWPQQRAARTAEVIERHMWPEVDPDSDPEGHLLEVGTGIDISGSRADLVAADVRDRALAAWPRLGLAAEFAAAFADQASRKPGCAAARPGMSSVGARLAAHPFEGL